MTLIQFDHSQGLVNPFVTKTEQPHLKSLCMSSEAYGSEEEQKELADEQQIMLFSEEQTQGEKLAHCVTGIGSSSMGDEEKIRIFDS